MRIVFLVVGITGILFTQVPDTQWTKTFGGGNDDLGYSVQQTSDGGYIITGVTHSFGSGNGDVYLIKTDGSGNLLWYNTFGGTDVDVGYSVQQTSDGGYIIAGLTRSFGAGYYDVYLVKTDSSGNLLWENTFGGGAWDEARSVQQTLDGGYIIAGFTYSAGLNGDVYLIKTDNSGNLLWYNTFGEIDYEWGFSVQQTSDGGYIVAGYTDSYGPGPRAVYLVKTDNSGNLLWYNTFGGSNEDIGFSVRETSDGGYIIAGLTRSFGAGSDDVYLIKTDNSGNLLWQNTFGGTSLDEARSVQQTLDGGYIIAGGTYSFGAGYEDVYLIRLEPEVGIVELDLYKKERNSGYFTPLFFSNEITLEVTEFSGSPLELVLYNLYGKKVFKRVYHDIYYSSLKIKGKDIEKLPAGVYFLSVLSGKRELGLFKLIKR